MEVDHIKAMQDLIGANVPIIVKTSSDGKLLSATYESEWKEGGTTPILNNKGKITGYTENYNLLTLTPEEIAQLDQYIADNVEV